MESNRKSTTMFKNYLKTAIRSILKKKIYSIINLLGLVIGITCSLLILIYIHFEINFDRFHSRTDQIYRINTEFNFGDLNMTTNLTPSAVLGTLLQDFPEIEKGTRVNKTFRPVVVESEEDQFQEENFFFADSTFFQVFDFPMVAGNPNTALSRTNNVVLTESSAIKYFGKTDILNEQIKVDNQTYLITGVVRDLPNNTHLQFDFLGSFVSLTWATRNDRWESANHFTFLVLNEETDLEVFDRKLQSKVEEKMGPFDGPNYVKMATIPLSDIHLRSDIPEELYKGSITYVYIFSFIALLIIVIACVNYMNLSTARSVQRAKEVGMRKVLGAGRPQLFIQFIGESAIVSLAAIILALAVTTSLIPQFADIAGRPLDASLLITPSFYGVLILFWIMTSFISGTYPALVLSSYAPGTVLKSSFKDSGSGAMLRKVLVIFQFAVSVFLFIGSTIIYQQLDFMQNKKLGYDKDQLVILPADRTVTKSFDSFKAELLTIPGVENAALANENLSQVRGGYGITVEGVPENENMLTTAMIISPEFVETNGLELIAGENFNNTDYTLSQLEEDPVQNVLINEECAKQLYLTPEEAVGRKSNLDGRVGVIKGVLKNFHFRSLKEKIQSMVFFIEPRYYNQLVVRLSTQDPMNTMASLKDAWDGSFNHRPFESKFLDQEYSALYKSEQQLKQVYTLFTGLAIFIGCLGLFGLVSFATVQRSKEIGIRKILGATIQSIFTLISSDFLKLVLIAFIIATPISYWLMNGWLTNFEYRIDFSWFSVGLTLFVQLTLALLVTSWQSIKAALGNPVDAIRNE